MLTEDEIKHLIELGYEQVSSRYRSVARLPVGCTGTRAMLRRNDYNPAWDEKTAASQYRRCYARNDGNELTLSTEEFAMFKALGGRVA